MRLVYARDVGICMISEGNVVVEAKMRIGQDDGFGNKVKGIDKDEVTGIGILLKGDVVIVKNIGNCVIATYKVR